MARCLLLASLCLCLCLGLGLDFSADIAGRYSTPSSSDCSVSIEYTSPYLRSTEEGDNVLIAKKEKNKIKVKKGNSGGRKAVIIRTVPGDGELQCHFNGSDIRLAPISSIIHNYGDKDEILPSDFIDLGFKSERHGIFTHSLWPRQVVWEVNTAHSTSTIQEKLVWQQLPFAGFYSDSRFPQCRRQIFAESLSEALLQGADAQSFANGCDGHSDVLWHNNQHVHLLGDRITVNYGRRYSYSQEIWEQIRALKKEEANAIRGLDPSDSLGDWWDKEGMESGTLQKDTGNILWDDGAVWERHDGLIHNKDFADGADTGNKIAATSRQTFRSRNNRHHVKVAEMREKAAQHSFSSQPQQKKNKKRDEREKPHHQAVADPVRKDSWGSASMDL